MHAMPIGELWRASCQSRLARPAAHAQALLLRWKAHGTPMPRIGRQPIHANLGHTSSKSSAHHRDRAAAARRERGVGNGPPGLRPGGRTTDWGGKALTAGGGCATLRQSPARGVAQRRPRIGVLLHLRWRKLERQLPVNNDKEEKFSQSQHPRRTRLHLHSVYTGLLRHAHASARRIPEPMQPTVSTQHVTVIRVAWRLWRTATSPRELAHARCHTRHDSALRPHSTGAHSSINTDHKTRDTTLQRTATKHSTEGARG